MYARYYFCVLFFAVLWCGIHFNASSCIIIIKKEQTNNEMKRDRSSYYWIINFQQVKRACQLLRKVWLMEKQARSPLCNTQTVTITFVRTCSHQQVTLSSLFTVLRCICLRQDVPVPNGYETPKLQCVVVLLRCNSYAIQSSSVPGVWVHVWDEEAFKKLSPSLLHQQACLV